MVSERSEVRIGPVVRSENAAVTVTWREFHGRKVWSVRHSEGPTTWAGEDVGECLWLCLCDLARLGVESADLNAGSEPWVFSEDFRSAFAQRRRAAMTAGECFACCGVKATDLLDFEEGSGELPPDVVSAVLTKVEDAELRKTFEVPARVSYSDRLAGLD